jgi:serine/threonine-protein kinase RsbW
VALVQLLIPPVPAHVRTARLVVAAAARRAGLDDDLVDELRLALGEACGRAVLLHAKHAAGTAVEISVRDDPAGLTVSVRDRGPAIARVPEQATADLLDDSADDDPDDELGDPDVALAVVQGLVDDVTVEPDAEGTTVTMRWPLPPRRLSGVPSTAAVSDPA